MGGYRVVQRICRGDGADEDEHDESHPLLPVVGTVEEADARAGKDEQSADGPRWRRVVFGRFIEGRILDQCLGKQEQQGSAKEADDWRDEQNLADLAGLGPVHARGAVLMLMSWLAMPTPMMDPTMVCELEAGRPSHQVLRFQMMAAMSSAKTMAKPAPALTCRINSTGSRVMTAKATAPEERSTPARLHKPDQTTAMLGSSEWV